MEVKFYDHPEYKSNKDDWIFYNDFYTGNQNKLREVQYLIPHEFELGENTDAVKIRRLREQRSFYINRIEQIVSRYVSIVFKKDPQLDDVALALLDKDLKTIVSTSGKDFISFLKEEIAVNYFVYGKPIVYTDSYAVKAPNAEVEKQLGLSPKFCVINPLDFKDWQHSIKGTFELARFEYKLIEPRANLTDEAKEETYCKVLIFDGTTYTVNVYKKVSEQNKDSWVLESTTPFTGFKDMPLRTIEAEESWIKDSTPIAKKLHNLESSRDNILYFQAYQRIFISGVTNQDHKKALTEFTISFLPDGATVTNIEPAQTTALDNNIKETKEELFKAAFNLSRSVAADSKMVEGADTQASSKEHLTSLLASQVGILENYANQILRDYAAFKIQDFDFKGKVTFNKDFTLEDINALRDSFLSMRDEINLYPTWRKELLKKIANELELDRGEEIQAEIEAGPKQANTGQVRGSILDRLTAQNGGN